MIIGWNASDDLVGSVNQSAGVTWNPVEEQSSVTLGKQYSKPLEQVPGLLSLLLPCVPGQGCPQPLNLPLCLLLPEGGQQLLLNKSKCFSVQLEI